MLDPRKMLLAALLGASILTEVSCSSSEKSSTDAVLHRLQRIILRNLHARRPKGPGADPLATPGGSDYTSKPLPDSKLDCKPIRDFFASEKLGAIRQCIQKIEAGQTIYYRVRFQAEPYLELEPSEDKAHPHPPCMKELLSRVIVPREIFFQSNEEGPLECYSSRLPVETGTMPALGTRWPFNRTRVEITFPLALTPQTDEETIALLETWALAPFMDSETQKITARVMDENLCRACIGEDNLYRIPDHPAPALWPE